MSDIDELEAKAKAATPGPWRIDPTTGDVETTLPAGNGDTYDAVVFYDMQQDDPDVAYITAASPDVILDLIRRVREAEEAHALERGAHEHTWNSKKAIVDLVRNLIAAIDRDGGHAQQEDFFLNTSIKRATDVVVSMTAERDAALASLEAMRVQLDEQAASYNAALDRARAREDALIASDAEMRVALEAMRAERDAAIAARDARPDISRANCQGYIEYHRSMGMADGVHAHTRHIDRALREHGKAGG